MRIVGIICEYNPFHLGHQKQFDMIRRSEGPDCGIVCLMSGNFVQRGHPAILHKSLRAQAAVECGADLVLELPLTACLSSAEGFAAGGVKILGDFCEKLCFGAEDADAQNLLNTARALLSPDFPPALRAELDKGLSFPVARAAALKKMGMDSEILSTPNNILAVEYCKAILGQGCAMEPMPIHRVGDYHDDRPDLENPSATAVRQLMWNAYDWKSCIPEPAQGIFEGATLHALSAGERAILYRLRTMAEEEFEVLPHGSEGLWRKLMHASRSCATLEEIACAVKSKRYTRTRIDRMILCAFLGLTAQDLAASAPYSRVLAFNDFGRNILNQTRNYGIFPNIGEKIDHTYQMIEDRADALYSLFAEHSPTAPDCKPRVFYRACRIILHSAGYSDIMQI